MQNNAKTYSTTVTGPSGYDILKITCGFKPVGIFINRVGTTDYTRGVVWTINDPDHYKTITATGITTYDVVASTAQNASDIYSVDSDGFTLGTTLYKNSSKISVYILGIDE